MVSWLTQAFCRTYPGKAIWMIYKNPLKLPMPTFQGVAHFGDWYDCRFHLFPVVKQGNFYLIAPIGGCEIKEATDLIRSLTSDPGILC